MKLAARLLALVLGAALFLTACAQQAKKVKLDPKKPMEVSVWHYYNGAQKDAFAALVKEFNDTEGRAQGIVVSEYSQESVANLKDSVMAAARKEVGAAELPAIFAAYADTAYALNEMGVVADIAPYFTADELAGYVDGYLAEGRLDGGESLKIFPVAKSTEVFMLNRTDWDKFAAASGASLSDLETVEGITETAQRYYAWTDSLTPDTANDGSAFFGRDAFANYMIIGAKQLGCEIFSVQNGKPVLNFDKTVVRKLWDHYYVPYVAGYFTAENRFRSDDVKTGRIIALVGSSSGGAYFPQERTVSDTQSYPIETYVAPAPRFAGGNSYAVQQGAGMVVTQGSEAQVYASVQFLKWLTQPQRNLAFSLGSGYLPVTQAANEEKTAEEAVQQAQTPFVMQEILRACRQTVNTCEMYTPQAFAAGTQAREVLERSMPEKAVQDRAAFAALLQQGASHSEALAQFDTDENFEAWYQATREQLEQLFA